LENRKKVTKTLKEMFLRRITKLKEEEPHAQE
jgi:hypothetical protein